ncbi:hypothetical protein Q5P01_003836 [Channa striata]|uniref:Uncharacterized protein n=1 Tax=Channa striata TaxID=64152 RepID=A0AA88T537_CHASR|nr:hypothetical protein Q5P01_003836 [Channa striata]
MGARQLSQIKEESSSREHSTCFLPPIVPQQQQSGKAQKPGAHKVDRQEVKHLVVLHEQRRSLEDNNSLLGELGRIEAEIRLNVERQQEAESHRQRENKLLWQSLLYLSLSQRVTKPWISSYFRMFPMHIYCLPIQTVNHKGRRRGLKQRR